MPDVTAAPPPGLDRLARYRPQFVSVALQALGSAATLAAALWVTWRFGLVAQGEFGLARSWFDASAALLALGLPQGVLHVLYRLQTPAEAVMGWMRGHLMRLSALAAAAALVIGAAAVAAPHSALALALAVVISVPFSVAHLLARSVLLPTCGPAVFGFYTALPSVLVLAGVLLLALGEANAGETLHWVLLAASVLAALASCAASRQALGPRSSLPAMARTELWRVSRESWLQAALAALLPAGLLSLLAALGGGSALGAASLGLLVYQVFVSGAGYLGPMVFDRQARNGAASESPLPWRRPVQHLLSAGLVFALPCLLTAAWWKHMSDGAAAQAWASLGLLLAAGCFALAVRLLSAVLQASNRYRELSRQAVWRLVLGLLVAALAARSLGAPVALALSLLATEAATLARLHAVLRREVGATP